MKKMVKVILAAAAVVALAVPAMAADKLIVKPATGTLNPLTVTDGGKSGFNVVPLYPVDVAVPDASLSSTLHFSAVGANSGGWLTSVSENNFFISSGAVYQNGQWIQRSTDGKSVFFGSGAAGFTAFLNQGATVGGLVTQSPKFRVTYDGRMGVGTLAPTSMLHVVGLPTYADNAAALAGGMTAGAFYRTSTGVLMVVF